MASKIKVLFICQHNSGRSQIAEAYLREIYGDHFEIESAGLEPAEAINPLVVAVMQEAGLDLSKKKPQSVSSSSNRARSTGMWSPFAMTPNPNAPFSPASPNAGTGRFPILRPSMEPIPKSLPRSATSGMR